MTRIIPILLLLIATVASAQTTAPSVGRAVRPATAPLRPATQPSAEELHAQAVEFMRLGKFDRARPPLEKAYNATPPQQRSRSLVLNRAILDVKQKSFVMRALRDLNDYLTTHRADDEVATNILGSALNTSADNQRWKQGVIWQAAFREWDRRNYVLDHSRPGFHRWGAEWLNEDQYLALRAKQKRHEQLVKDQLERLARVVLTLDPLDQRFQELAAEQQRINGAVPGNSPLAQQQQALGRQRAGQTGYDPGVNLTDPAIFEQIHQAEINRNNAEFARLRKEIDLVQARINDEQKVLATLQEKAPRPIWPMGFDAIDPNEPAPKAFATTGPATLPIGPAAATYIPVGPNAAPAPNAQPAPPAPNAPNAPAAATQPAGEDGGPLRVPFGPREVDKLNGR